MSAIHYGGLSSTLFETAGSPHRVQTVDADVVTRTFKVRVAGITGGLPAFGSADSVYTDHYVSRIDYKATGEDDIYEVTIDYSVLGSGGTLNPNAPLPVDEVEYIAGTTERHIGAHPSYDPAWLGNPKTDGVADPRGNPTTEPTKKGVENYLIPTGIYRKTSYSHTKPDLNIQDIGKRKIPTGESGSDRWLYTGYTLKITKGVYQLSEEYTFLPIGTWDTDIYASA